MTEQCYSVADAAKGLGIHPNLIYKWRQISETVGDQSLRFDERAELMKRRKEVKNLKIEKEILKKASAFFAREMK